MTEQSKLGHPINKKGGCPCFLFPSLSTCAELLTIPGHMRSPSVFSGVRVVFFNL